MTTVTIVLRKCTVEYFMIVSEARRYICIKNCDFKNQRSEVGITECGSTDLHYQRKYI